MKKLKNLLLKPIKNKWKCKLKSKKKKKDRLSKLA